MLENVVVDLQTSGAPLRLFNKKTKSTTVNAEQVRDTKQYQKDSSLVLTQN